MPVKDDRRYIDVSWAPDASSPSTPVGVILLAEEGKSGGFRYYDSYTGPAIAPDLEYQPSDGPAQRWFPLSIRGQEHMRLRDRKDLHRVFMDALPGGWGETVMISHSRLYAEGSPAEKLWMLGDRRVGALHFETGGGKQLEHYIEGDAALDALRQEVQRFADKLFESKVIPFPMGTEAQRWALTVNSGSTPKCAFKNAGTEYVAKFSEQVLRTFDTTRVERGMLELSRQCGLDTVDAVFVHCGGETVLCTKRYDARPDGGYDHHINAATALNVPLNMRLDYSEIADFLRAEGSSPDEDVPELFGRMLYNAYTNNTDDHLGQFEFVQNEQGWRLAPNLDLLIEPDANRQHKLTMAGDSRPGYDVAWIDRAGESMGLDNEQAREIAYRVTSGIAQHWVSALEMSGVDKKTIAGFEPAIQTMRLNALRAEISTAMARENLKRGMTPAPTLGM